MANQPRLYCDFSKCSFLTFAVLKFTSSLYFQCEWLLGGRDVIPSETQITGCIPEDSELFKALVEDPQIQVGLNNTKCLIGRDITI